MFLGGVLLFLVDHVSVIRSLSRRVLARVRGVLLSPGGSGSRSRVLLLAGVRLSRLLRSGGGSRVSLLAVGRVVTGRSSRLVRLQVDRSVVTISADLADSSSSTVGDPMSSLQAVHAQSLLQNASPLVVGSGELRAVESGVAALAELAHGFLSMLEGVLLRAPLLSPLFLFDWGWGLSPRSLFVP